jgi:aryl-alcohol dehydrogenase-like predicted oxidoreductase
MNEATLGGRFTFPGVNHIDTADYYGPHITNQMIRQALRTRRGW